MRVRQVYSFSLHFRGIDIVNFHGSGLEGSVGDQEVDITFEVCSNFRFLVHILKVMDFNFLLPLLSLFRRQNNSNQNVLPQKNGREASPCKTAKAQ